jgi:hypothetical protein
MSTAVDKILIAVPAELTVDTTSEPPLDIGKKSSSIERNYN